MSEDFDNFNGFIDSYHEFAKNHVYVSHSITESELAVEMKSNEEFVKIFADKLITIPGESI
jgi:hypothetical protein